MLKNQKFARYAIAFCILGVIFNFLYSGLSNDQINIIQGFSAWPLSDTQLPMTVGSFVCIALTFVYGLLFIHFGVRKVLIPCICVAAVGCIGIAGANGLQCYVSGGNIVGSYLLYFISAFVVKCAVMCLQMSGFQLAVSWFIRYRGRVLGIITLGSPLFSVVGTSAMISFITKRLHGDYRPFYVGICVVLVLVAALTALLLRDFPEDVGLYPDGMETPPQSEHSDDIHMSVGQVLRQPKSWMLIVSFGAFQMVIGCCMAAMVAWFSYLVAANPDAVAAGAFGEAFAQMGGLAGQGAMVLFVEQAAIWLSVGAILGIPISFLFGVIDDKFGTPVACLVMGITELLPVIGLMTQGVAVAKTGACNVPMLLVWGVGVACMTGGVPTMHPASISFAFGRREYQSANRIIMAIQLIPCSFGASIMMALIQTGKGMLAWGGVLAVVILGILFVLPMFKMKDANAEDRDCH